MGNVHMEASQINYRKGGTKMSVEQALQSAKGGYDYSTNEYSTNSKWIDGSEIFGKIIPLTAGTITGTNMSIDSGLTNVKIIGISAIFDITGTDSVKYAIPVNMFDSSNIAQTASIKYDYTNNKVAFHLSKGGSWAVDGTGFIELRYIKVTPPAEPES